MSLPEAIKQLLFQFDARFPVPTGTPGDEHEENVRQWTLRFCQQVAYSFPNQGYGSKRSAPGYPLSKDSLAKRSAEYGLESWDLLLGVGTGNPQLSHDPQYHHIPGQVFVPVEPVNHLSVSQPAPVPAPDTHVPDSGTPNAPCQGCAEVLDALHEMRLENAERWDALLSILARLENNDRRPRPFTGSARFIGTMKGEVGGVDG